MNFRADRMVSLRKASGYKQTELAAELGTTQAQISLYERGSTTPSTDTVVALAQTLNTTTDYLLGRSNIPHPGAEPDPHPDLTPTEIDMLGLFRSHTPDDQKRVLAALLALRGIGSADSDAT